MSVGSAQADHHGCLHALFLQDENVSEYRCAYWNFSDPLVVYEILVVLEFNCPLSLLISVGNGSWAFDGIEMVSSTTEDGMTTVNCTSTHLTSFAVLVDVSGVLSNDVSSSFEVVCT